jgi:membrane protease YdiL (CAAX protease family)
MDLGMPLIPVDPIWRFPVIYVPLLVASVVVMRVLGYGRNDVGLNFRAFPVQLGVASSGLLFGWVEYLILRPGGMITQFTWSEVLPLALIFVASTWFVEEFAFRGILQRSAVDAFGGWRGIVYISLLFAILHMGFHSWLDVVFVFGVAIFFGWVVKKTGSLLGVTLAHGLTNIMLFLVIPFFF